MQPTDEQVQALDLFASGTDLAIEAGAGTGKTATLLMIGNSTPRAGQYLAFNKAIVAEAKRKVPDSVGCSTAHGLAMKAIGYRYAHRLRSQRMLSSDVADKLDLRPLTITALGERKLLRPGYLAGLVMRTITNFCNSDEPEPSITHVPYIEGIDAMDNGKRTHYNNRRVASHIEHTLTKAWADICNPEGTLRFGHDHYLKLWQLSEPKIPADYILFDEAQDASPVMLDIVRQQAHAQRIYVGDTNQQIYEWRGAVNALASLEGAQRTFLSKSFRFGPAIAEAANMVLTVLDAELRLEGAAAHESNLGPLDAPTAYLYRTNAASLGRMLELLVQGKKPYLVGEGAEILAFARAVDQLQEKGFTTHPELACFSSWFEVLRYVNDDEQGSELKLMVDIVVRFGTPTIRRIFEQMVDESAADVVISTAHKGKGREWSTVRLGDDYPDVSESDADWRLLYVAATRARVTLDYFDCDPLAFLLPIPEVQVT